MLPPGHYALSPYCLGTKLRLLRTQRRITLLYLAKETGLSTALLSKLETGRMIPTLPTLGVICTVYGVALSYFFSEPERHTMSITRRAHMQASWRRGELTDSVPLEAPGRNHLGAEVIHLSSTSPDLALADAGGRTCAVVYVIQGRLRCDVGYATELLDTGDCAHIDTRLPITCKADGKNACRLLVVRCKGASQPSNQTTAAKPFVKASAQT